MNTRSLAFGAWGLALTGLVATGLYATGLLTGRAAGDAFAACAGGVVAGATIGGPFELVDETGRTVTDAEVLTQPSLIYFGYTFCPDVCPMDTMRNAEAVEILEERGIMVTPVFISIDPARDTPEKLLEWTDVFHPRMIGLTGSEEQVAAASRAYRTFYQKRDAEDEFYLMDHSVQSYLVLPGHGFVEFFNSDVTPEDVADRSECFIKAA